MKILSNGLMVAALLGAAACGDATDNEPNEPSSDEAVAQEQESDVLAQEAPARPRFPGFDGDGGIPGFPGFPGGRRPDGESIQDIINRLRDAGFPGFGDGGVPSFPGFPGFPGFGDGGFPNFPGFGDGGFPGFPGGRLPNGESIEDILNKLRDGGINLPGFPGRGGFPGLPGGEKKPAGDAANASESSADET